MSQLYQTTSEGGTRTEPSVVPMAPLRELAEVWRLYVEAGSLMTYQDTTSRDIGQRGDAMVAACCRDLERILDNVTQPREEIPG